MELVFQSFLQEKTLVSQRLASHLANLLTVCLGNKCHFPTDEPLASSLIKNGYYSIQ